MSSANLLQRILWDGKSRWQLAGALVGTFTGMLLLLLSLQLYQNIRQVVYGSAAEADQYLMINKRVSLFNTLGVSAAFTEEQIGELEKQDFVTSVGVFTPSKYRVSASSSLLGFYTELFFESVDPGFVDLQTDDWHWEKGQREVPILLSRDYLALYNFGFAPSQGLPQFTPKTIRRVSFDLTVQGQGKQEIFQGRIVGFSDRINSILVPPSFMEWSNTTFGGREKAKPSRLILACENIYSKPLATYLKENNYELSRGGFIGDRFGSVLGIVLSLVAAIGLIILGLSLLVFLLNFQLFISQSAQDIRYLLQLGYSQILIRQVLQRRLLYLYGGVILAVVICLVLGHQLMLSKLTEQGFQLESKLHWSVWAVALLSTASLIYLNYRNIKKRIEGLFI